MTPLLEYSLVALIAVVIVLLIITTVYLVKFLKETSNTMHSISELTDMAKTELQPSLQSVSVILDTAKNIATSTNKKLDNIRKIITTVLGAGCMLMNNVKSKGGFLSGIISGFSFFRNKRR